MLPLSRAFIKGSDRGYFGRTLAGRPDGTDKARARNSWTLFHRSARASSRKRRPLSKLGRCTSAPIVDKTTALGTADRRSASLIEAIVAFMSEKSGAGSKVGGNRMKVPSAPVSASGSDAAFEMSVTATSHPRECHATPLDL